MTKVENIVAKGEIARFEQFLLLSLCFQKSVCCRSDRKRLYEGKGKLPKTKCIIESKVKYCWEKNILLSII